MVQLLRSCLANAFHCFPLLRFWNTQSKRSSCANEQSSTEVEEENNIFAPSSRTPNCDLHSLNHIKVPMEKCAADTYSLASASGLRTKATNTLNKSFRASTPCVNTTPVIICCNEEVISRKASLQSLYSIHVSCSQKPRRSVGSVCSNSVSVKVEAAGETLAGCSDCSIFLDGSSSQLWNDNSLLLGKFKLAVQYSKQKKLLILTVLEVKLDSSTPAADNTGKEIKHQVRLALLAEKVVKFRTKYCSNGVFNETFVFNIPPNELVESVVRCRLYQKGVRSKLHLGEAFFRASIVDARSGVSSHYCLSIRPSHSTTTHNPMSLLSRNSSSTPSTTISTGPTTTSFNHYSLPPATNNSSALGTPVSTPIMPLASGMSSTTNSASRRSSTVDDCGRFCSLPESKGTPEVLVSLCYAQDQSNVFVGVEKATGFDSAASMIGAYLNSNLSASKAPDTFVRISALSEAGAELGKHKSETVKASMEPNYNTTAVFQITAADLDTSNVLIQVFSYCGILRRKVLLGWICLGGENANSPDAQQHWQEMQEGIGTTVSKWHNLMKPTQPRN